MASSSLSLPVSLVSYLAICRLAAAATAPVAATWSDDTFGPDGPWPAIEVTLSEKQTIAMYPGREFQTFLLTSDYCNQNRSLCYANQAGLYNDAESQVDTTGSTGQIQYQSGPDYMFGVDVEGAKTTSWVDTVNFGGQTIESVSLALLNGSYMAYPNGNWYPLSVGCLGIGAPSTVNQSFSNSFGPLINASLIPGYLWEHNKTASNSFGMHIGSANPRMPGSFYFGGYDQNRIVGDILNYEDDYTKEITLKDISINVIDGSSPWGFESLGGLLASGNSSITSGGLQVKIDGCSPYLSLPKSTCDAVAKNLPVTYNEGLGLYYWNTNDSKYTQIVNSASALEFVFAGSSNTQNVSISVPFRHLNLTLTAPLVDNPTQYFPCYTGPGNSYTLGRAFLQDAFVGANWGTKSWWLAQAPGPNVPSPSVVELANGDTTIKASSNDWKESWTGSWTALTPDEVNSSATVGAPSATVSQSTASPPAGLSTGAKAGIGVGVGIVGLGIIGAIAFFFLRRRKAAPSESAASNTAHTAQNMPQYGFYAPVKNPSSPGMTESTIGTVGQPPNGMMYAQPYPQPYSQQYPQPYPQQYPQQYMQQPYGQPYSTELSAVGNTPTELPGSTTYDPHMLDGTQVHSHASPQQSYSSHSPHSPSYGTTQPQAHSQDGPI
ncbi:acid protease [Hypoxylon sp. FL0890]|nr:acid protease [Hypoxylon sp. FL0890]